MSIQFSDVLKAQKKVSSGTFSVRSIDLQALGVYASPVLVLDNFWVTGRPFPPHPHLVPWDSMFEYLKWLSAFAGRAAQANPAVQLQTRAARSSSGSGGRLR